MYSEQAVTGMMHATLISFFRIAGMFLSTCREGLEWEFRTTRSEDDAVEQSITLAVVKAEETKVIIITTSIELCEKVGSGVVKQYSG